LLPVATYTCITALLEALALTTTLCGCRYSHTVILCCCRCSHTVTLCWYICVDHCSSWLHTPAQQDSLGFFKLSAAKCLTREALLFFCSVDTWPGCKWLTCCRTGSMGNMLPQTATPAYPSSTSGSRKVCHSVVPSKA